jgi:hypothetical protein
MTSLEDAPSGLLSRPLPLYTKEVVTVSHRELPNLVPVLGTFWARRPRVFDFLTASSRTRDTWLIGRWMAAAAVHGGPRTPDAGWAVDKQNGKQRRVAPAAHRHATLGHIEHTFDSLG